MAQQVIVRTLEEYLHSNDGPEWERLLAYRFNVLPLMADWTVLFAIRTSGDVITITHDVEKPVVEPVADERLRNMALKQGSLRFAAIQTLVPQRPDDAFTCESCDGAGTDSTLPAHLRDRIICWCGGLGWIPSSAARMPHAKDEATAAHRWWQFWRKGAG